MRNQNIRRLLLMCAVGSLAMIGKPHRAAGCDDPAEIPMRIEQFTASIRNNPGDADNYWMRGYNYHELAVHGMHAEAGLASPGAAIDKAFADFDEAVRLAPDKYLGERAVMNLLLERYDKAAADYAGILRKFPDTKYLVGGGAAHFMLGNYDLAVRLFERIPRDPAGDYEVLAEMLRGVALKRRGDPLASGSGNSLEAERRYVRGLLYSGMILFDGSNEGLADFKAAVELDPGVFEYNYMYGMALLSIISLEYELVVEHFTKMIENNPDDARLYAARAKAHRGVPAPTPERFKKAIADYGEAIRLAPDSTKYRFERGLIYCTDRQYIDSARADHIAARRGWSMGGGAIHCRENYWLGVFTELIRQYPDSAKFYAYRGSMHFYKYTGSLYGGRYHDQDLLDKSLADYDSALRLAPGEPNYYEKRGEAFVYGKSYDSAIVQFSEAIRLAPNVHKYYRLRGDAHCGKDAIDSAVADYARAMRLNARITENMMTCQCGDPKKCGEEEILAAIRAELERSEAKTEPETAPADTSAGALGSLPENEGSTPDLQAENEERGSAAEKTPIPAWVSIAAAASVLILILIITGAIRRKKTAVG